MPFSRFALVALASLIATTAGAGQAVSGYTAHFTHLHSVADARRIVGEAGTAGARLLNVVPPARIWQRALAVEMLDAIFADAERRGMRIVLTRLDACYPDGYNEFFRHVLTQRGRMPNGAPTPDWFMATVGVPAYERWLDEETRYYARRYGARRCLAGFSPGGFVEPFVSQRGSIACFDEKTDCYEIAQYTPAMRALWRRWLQQRYTSLAAANADYGSDYAAWFDFPLPRNEGDSAYSNAGRAYFDFVRCIGDWWLSEYRALRTIWHSASGSPFIWQLSGFEAEKLAKGRPAFAALDVPRWLQEADAVGLSLYTYPGFPEGGHAAICATVRLVAGAVEAGKPFFVLEGGNERPAISYDPYQLAFITRIALPLRPAAQVYEYFKYQPSGAKLASGMMLDEAFRRNEPAYEGVQRAYAAAERLEVTAEKPWLTFLELPEIAREDTDGAGFMRLAYDAAGYLPVRILGGEQLGQIPRGAWVALPPDPRRIAGAAFYGRLGTLAAVRKWHLVRDRADTALGGAKHAQLRLNLRGLCRLPTVEAGTDALVAALRGARAGEAQPAGVVPRRALATIPLHRGAIVFAEDRGCVSVDLRALPVGVSYRLEVLAQDRLPRTVRLAGAAGAVLQVKSGGQPVRATRAGAAALQFSALPRRDYAIRWAPRSRIAWRAALPTDLHHHRRRGR